MMDFAAARTAMVDGQVRTADVTDLRLLRAMLEVPREHFVSPAQAALAYLDHDLAIGAPASASSRRLIKPMVLGKLLQLAQIGPANHVLNIGCATGYTAALLARLCASVVALEEDAELATAASRLLAQARVASVSLVSGPLAAGWPSAAPYDAIVLDGSVEMVPPAILRQLRADGGCLVGIVGAPSLGRAMIYTSVGGTISARAAFDAVGPLLPGFAAPAAFVF
ncbi:MAG: protein-L-isoaspartate O-methyltransferase [Proteobacteria bacterium]|nr:protein-L-isoaspartate O-methyltransferase [Pseudomonadota bacterium]